MVGLSPWCLPLEGCRCVAGSGLTALAFYVIGSIVIPILQVKHREVKFMQLKATQHFALYIVCAYETSNVNMEFL